MKKAIVAIFAMIIFNNSYSVQSDVRQVRKRATSEVSKITSESILRDKENAEKPVVEESPIQNNTVTTSSSISKPKSGSSSKSSGHSVYADNTAGYSDDDLAILDQVYKEVITNGNESYLRNFSKEELGIIRNTIYAKRGYIFKTDKYRNYFSKKPWYKGVSASSNIIPKDEEKLANIIKRYE